MFGPGALRALSGLREREILIVLVLTLRISIGIRADRDSLIGELGIEGLIRIGELRLQANQPVADRPLWPHQAWRYCNQKAFHRYTVCWRSPNVRICTAQAIGRRFDSAGRTASG